MIKTSREEFDIEKAKAEFSELYKEYPTLEAARKAYDSVVSYYGETNPYTLAAGYYIFGMTNLGLTTDVIIGGSIVKIDKSIAEIIKVFNDAGIKTMCCCSGLRCDHPPFPMSNGEICPFGNHAECGYIGFEYDDSLYERLCSFFARSDIYEVSVTLLYYRKGITVHIRYDGTDEQLMHYWDTLFHLLMSK